VKILIFLNGLGLGGTEKAACRWARGLVARGHIVSAIALADGSRRPEFESAGVSVRIIAGGATPLAAALSDLSPAVIHAHAPGSHHGGDVLGAALKLLPKKIPVVQSNVFGLLENPPEDVWTDLRIFVSWTGCVQAARRRFRPLDERFFRRNSVVVNPLDPDDGPDAAAVAEFRRVHGILSDEVVFGHLGRPDPIRWDRLPIEAFRQALGRCGRVKMLLREPPPEITATLRRGPDPDRFLILPVTTDPRELRLTTAAMDVVLHYSKIGESFGYGVAEPMNLGKPAIVNSTPWRFQAQLELVRHGECGFVASTRSAMAAAIISLANDPSLREKMGRHARAHIRQLTDPETSLGRLEAILRAAIEGRDNPLAATDLVRARATANYMDEQQFGHSWREQLALRPFHYRVRFHEFREVLKSKF
jgi:glycosyltransferase involved in cell wall biosynthesis